MKRIKVVFTLLSVLLAGPVFGAAISVNWTGSRGLMPQISEGSAYAAFNGKMYVFGGFTYDLEHNKVFIYDTATGTWSAGPDMPTARFYSSACELGGKIYVTGGGKLQGGSAVSLASVEIFDTASGSWSTGVSMPAALRGHSAVAGNGKIYVFGGKTASVFSNTVYQFDPSGGTWSNFSTSPFAAAYGGAIFSPSQNKAYFIGGMTDDPASPASYMGKAYGMSLSGGAWDASSYAMPFKTANFATAHDSVSGKAYLVGGIINYSEEMPYFDIQVFDAASGSFESGTLALMPSPLSRYNNAAAIVSGKLYLAAGAGALAADEYSISGDSWYQPNAKMPEDISGAASAVMGGKFYVVDGGFWSPIPGAVYEYTPSSNSWAKKNGQDPQARMYAAWGAYNGELYISGGMNNSGAVLNGVVSYDPASDSFSPVSATDPYPAIFPASAVHNGKLYVFGGRTTPGNQNSLSAKTRTLDIAGSSFTTGPDLPFALEQASAVTIGDKIYIFGGATTTAPDYMNKNVIIFDPATQVFTTGPAIPYPVYGSSATAFGSFALFDSGYYLYYSAPLQGLAGGPFSFLQAYDTASGTFTALARPYAKLNHSTAVIGAKYYATGGDDGSWPSSRLDIADIVTSGCSFTCTAGATPQAGAAPLTVRFDASSTGSGCTGAASYSWNFGDGGTSTEQNPSHDYQAEGSYTWNLTVTWNGQTCLTSGTIEVGGCVVTCDVTAGPLSGDAPLTVGFSALSTASGCSSEVGYTWEFGDGGEATGQETSHTYDTPGTYTWAMTAAADQASCLETGTVTVTQPGTCSVACTASAVPSSGSAPLVVAFSSTATPSNCPGTPAFLWSFGDGSNSTEQNPSHTYSTAGTYNWTLTATVDGTSCAKSGSVTATGSQEQPSVNSVSKAGSPFRLKVIGAKYVDGCQVMINGVPVPITKYKSFSYLVAKKGAALKAMVPKGVTVKITVKNPDGTESNEYSYTR